jgi:hypothetical protein
MPANASSKSVKSCWHDTGVRPVKLPGVFSTRPTPQSIHGAEDKLREHMRCLLLAMGNYIQLIANINWEVFLQLVSENRNGAPMMDISAYTAAFAYDLIGEVRFGRNLYLVRTGSRGKGNDLTQAVVTSLFIMTNSGYLPGRLLG